MHPRRQPRKSPGGPPLADQRRLYIELMSKGMSNTAACRVVGVNRRTGTRWRRGRTITNRAGQPRTYKPIVDRRVELSTRWLTEGERVIIADGLLAGRTVRAIAGELGRSPSTVSREIRRNRDPESGRYFPFRAHRRSIDRRARPKTGKLAENGDLAAAVQNRLDRRWSPEQIAKTLGVEFPDRPEMRVSHETIYQALYAPEHSIMRPEAARVLRTGRVRRKERHRPDRRTSRFVEPMVMISERPAEVAERSVPGHWEGDLLMGTRNRSAIATLVERTSRFLVLVHLADGHNAEQVSTALINALGPIPELLRRSLTWDQGSEMGCHGDLSLATGVPVFFCDPASPWQRGSNENTNGLLRQYFPKGSDLSRHTREELAAVAEELNQRPRKTLGWQTPAAIHGASP
jgi:IS30 family transposase